MGIQKGDGVYYINSPEFTGGLGKREVSPSDGGSQFPCAWISDLIHRWSSMSQAGPFPPNCLLTCSWAPARPIRLAGTSPSLTL